MVELVVVDMKQCCGGENEIPSGDGSKCVTKLIFGGALMDADGVIPYGL